MVNVVARKGIATDMELYEEICDSPGLSCYELAKKTGWLVGGSGPFQEAGEGQLITVEKIREGPKRLVYPMNWTELGEGKPKKKC
ncbi:MAG TPA: hypothetical protein VJ574_06170 [Candidatus Bathyarchaeia archaeon]|nr:MAG: hypothetical protein A3K70_02070 [Candidatus Bathyarchaeota archaeon RBG_16_48_13]HJX23972.1 hypothetical protein [Candidatus Bathyarchaeia archaeon]